MRWTRTNIIIMCFTKMDSSIAVGKFVRGLQDKMPYLDVTLKSWKETDEGYDITVHIISTSEGDSKAPDMLEDENYTNIVHTRARDSSEGSFNCSQTLYAHLDVGTIVVHLKCIGTEFKYHTTSTIVSPKTL